MISVPIRCRSIEGLGHTLENPSGVPGNGLNGISLNREAAGTTLEQLEVLPSPCFSSNANDIASQNVMAASEQDRENASDVRVFEATRC